MIITSEKQAFHTTFSEYVFTRFRLMGIDAVSTVSPPLRNFPYKTLSFCDDEIADIDRFTKLEPVNETWTEVKNQRRCDLINRKYSRGLNPEETVELAHLQEQMLSYRDRVAPLPIEAARRLYQKILTELNGTQSPTDS
ncbi:MAG TPA: hypothetical protein VG097_12005 [Gemmata sp.]|jgi:hypothetical protein|nr:hypothetical protein [Gemmata sp.]